MSKKGKGKRSQRRAEGPVVTPSEVADVMVGSIGGSISKGNASVLLLLKAFCALVITFMAVIFVLFIVSWGSAYVGHEFGLTSEADLPTVVCFLLLPGLVLAALLTWALIRFLSFIWDRLGRRPWRRLVEVVREN